MTRRHHSAVPILAVVLVTLVAACGSTSPASQQLGAAKTASYPSSSTSVSPTELADPATTVPNQVSNLPDGVYRTQLDRKALQRLGVDDLGAAGTQTLTVKAGNYQLDCHPMANLGVDCGNHDPSMPDTVEAGTVRGGSGTVWFVHDMARLSKITGCLPQSQSATGCGPEGGYHLDWKKVAGGLVFSNFVGLGDEAGEPAMNVWTAQLWTQIS